jgi:hypothetical protein
MGLSIGADVLGISGNLALFTRSGSIECFLPAGGTPGTLDIDYSPCAAGSTTSTSAGWANGRSDT